MGKLAKPQRSSKHKKIKSIDPFYRGSRGNSRTEGLNQKPKNYDQEVPKSLKNLGFTINGVQTGKVGKKSKNKFLKNPDGPSQYKEKFAAALKTAASESKSSQSKSTEAATTNKSKPHEEKAKKDFKKGPKSKVSDEVFNEYVDNLQPRRAFVEPFNFKQKPGETEKHFNRRVDTQANRALVKSKMDEHFDVSDEKKMKQKMIKVKKGMSEKKKQRLKDKKSKKTEAEKEKKYDRSGGFASLKDDKVEFGDVVHAPPVLSVRPKKAAASDDTDRPGKRMPELQAVIAANMRESQQQKLNRPIGTSVKRRDLSTLQQRQADSQREGAIEAYRSMKKKLKQ